MRDKTEYVCLLNGKYFVAKAYTRSEFRALAKEHFGIHRNSRLPDNADVMETKSAGKKLAAVS